MNPNRVAEVNKALRARGEQPRLHRGTGYYFFSGGDTSRWPTSSVWVYRSEALTVEEWLAEYDRLKTEALDKLS